MYNLRSNFLVTGLRNSSAANLVIFRKNACSCGSNIYRFFIKKFINSWGLVDIHDTVYYLELKMRCNEILFQNLLFWVDLCAHHKLYLVENRHCLARFEFLHVCFVFCKCSTRTKILTTLIQLWHKLIPNQ